MIHTRVVEQIKTHILCSIARFFENLVICEIMWKNIVQPDTPQMTVWRMPIACWISKAKNTPSEYVLLTAFPLQQWLHDRALMLRYTYVLCLSRSFPSPLLRVLQSDPVFTVTLVVGYKLQTSS